MPFQSIDTYTLFMTAELSALPETIHAPDKVLTLEKKLPGPFAALQHTYGPVPR